MTGISESDRALVRGLIYEIDGLEEEAEEVRRAGSVQQQISIGTRYCREHGLSLSNNEC